MARSSRPKDMNRRTGIVMQINSRLLFAILTAVLWAQCIGMIERKVKKRKKSKLIVFALPFGELRSFGK
jgi:hypothetical protein